MDLTRLCLNKQYSIFFSNHTHIKLKKKFKAITMSTINRKYTRIIVAPCFVFHSFGLRIFIVEQSDSVNDKQSKLFFLVNFQYLVVYISKHFTIFMN